MGQAFAFRIFTLTYISRPLDLIPTQTTKEGARLSVALFPYR
jgi:hypothetical protein